MRCCTSPRCLAYALGVADYFLVERARGPAWDHSRSRREQDGWDEHAAFMDGLVEEGFVVLGGPMGVGDGDNVLLIVDAPDGGAARLAEDPVARRAAHDRARRRGSVAAAALTG